MKKSPIIITALLATAGVHAQDGKEPSTADDTQAAPPRAQVIEEDETSAAPDPKTEKTEEPKLVKPKEGSSPEVDPAEAEGVDANAEESSNDETEPVVVPEHEGIQIQVEKVASSSGGTNNGGEIKVYSPFPAKPLDTPPLGWKFVPASSGVDPYRTTVKLSDEKSVDLSITPYVLVPASDGRNVIRIAEPGYRPELTYMQNETIGAILQHSTEEIEHTEKQTSQAINRLQQLLSSLPQTPQP
ncbi:hypothetical protein HW115_04550 [Verrucomicrobiaceae bacterium N1E253]|uniref:Uncharacterized protein n=1 Tax=Oceaniferula marina TaxID=2748318 RepID=A0A851GBR7_9BACT|nr:hypothetical protein [Oceaniferula marina]NWK54866.1 hypothetical protein [Oceaniferula marina]